MKTLFLVLFVTLTSKFALSQIDSALAVQLQAELDQQVNTLGNHGVSAYLILQNGNTWSGRAGVNGQNQLITDSTVYIAASISKLNVATLLLLFQEDGLLDLDDTWHQYLPSLNTAIDTNITIRQLLNHTSGIADYLEVPSNSHYVTDDFSRYYTPEYIMENIVSSAPDFPAGTNFNYSNSNYCLAAMVAEAATPLPIQTEFRNRIWNPAGMNHTYLGAYEPINDQRAGTWWNFGGGLVDYSNQSDTSMLSFGFGTDNVVTCPKDLANLVHSLLNGQILSAQSFNEMQTFVPQSYVNQWVAGYGLGLHHLLGQYVDTVCGHNGKFMNNSDVFHSSMCGFTLAVQSNTETLWEGIYNPMYDIIRNYFQCNSVPLSNFHASQRIACTGTSITFSDSSLNASPTAWNWSFPGGTFTGGTSATDSMPQVYYASPGTYPVSYTASTNAGSNSITKNSYITINSSTASYNSPYSEGFESVSIPNSDWNINNNNTSDWTVTTIGAATGNNSIYIDNFNNTPGNKSRLISTGFDLTGFGSPQLTFKLAYQQTESTDQDKLQIFTSINCGANWTLRWSKIGSTLANITPPSSIPLTPSSGQFTTYTVNLGSAAGSSNVRIKFEFTADNDSAGNNIYIDDINLFDASIGLLQSEIDFDINLFPNPSEGEVTIDLKLNNSKNISVSVNDILGRNIENHSAKKFEAGKSSIIIGEKNKFNTGVYFVNINIDGNNVTRKIIIQ